MEKENFNNNQEETKQESPKKPVPVMNDRLKRDEWSEGAVSCLLEAYESKWVLRNRAKLKGHDWEEVASYVSARCNNTKSPKTQTQCKNKIESMKKRYRSESANNANADGSSSSSWLLYPRLDLLLRGSNATPPPQQQQQQQQSQQLAINPPLILIEASPAGVAVAQQPPPSPPPPPPPPPPPQPQNSNGSIGVDHIMDKEDGGVGTKSSDHVSEKKVMDTDSSTPAANLYSDKENLRSKKLKMKMEKNKKRKREEWEIAESIRWLAEVVVRSEQARMETMREIEKLRAEAEAKRGELDLKRTEIIANTQLEIAKLFAANAKGVDSSLKIGRD